MEEAFVDQFYIMGLSVRTTVQDGKAPDDVAGLWTRFFGEKIIDRIPGKIGLSIYCAYTDYELDQTRPFTAILGCKVNSLKHIPEGLVGKVVPAGKFTVSTVKGKIEDGIVFLEWMKIWHYKWPRAYQTDYELYSEKASDTDNAEVDIFVSLKD
jgi:predicted transcriptional regulator YdeE